MRTRAPWLLVPALIATVLEPPVAGPEPWATVIDPWATVIDPSATVIEPSATVVEPSATAIEPPAAAEDPEQAAADRAWDLFVACDEPTQRDVLARARERLAALADPEVIFLRERIEHAAREARRGPAQPLRFHDPAVYAPNQAQRAFAPADSPYAIEQWEAMQPWLREPGFCERWRHDFGDDVVRPTAKTFAPHEEFFDLFHGYLPDTDLLVAWLSAKLDVLEDLDRTAEYFEHAYCDREGVAFPGIAIYDAYASQRVIEMPDTDVIAFAREVAKDRSYRAPIPPDRRRDALYEKTKEAFARYRMHRGMVETIARLYPNPDAWLHPDVEGMRNRVQYLFVLTGRDPNRIRDLVAKHRTRDALLAHLDAAIEADRARYDRELPRLRERSRAARAAIAGAAVDTLRACGFYR